MYDKALKEFQQVLEYRQSVLPADHEDLARTCLLLGKAYQGRGKPDDYKRAIELYEKARSIRVKVYGIDHPSSIEAEKLIQNLRNNLP